MNHIYYFANLGGVDLNAEALSRHVPEGISSRTRHVFWKDPVCTTDGFPAVDDLYANRRSIWRRSPCSYAGLHRTLSHLGVRTIDVSRKPAGYRGLSVGTSGQAVPHGHSLASETLHPGRCQRTQRLGASMPSSHSG